MRRFIVRIGYLRKLDLISRLQRVARQKMGVRKLEIIRENIAATKIQTEWRRYIQRKKYLQQRAFIIHLQAASRAHLTRKSFSHIREHFAAIKIQSLLRGWAVRKEYQAKRKHAIQLQTCIRRRLARKQLLVLKQEAKSANHFKEVSYKLESKVVELTQSVTQYRDEKDQLRVKANDLEMQVKSWAEKYEKLDSKAKSLEKSLEEPSGLQIQLEALEKERNGLQNDYRNSMERIKKQDLEIARLTEDLSRQKEEINKLRQSNAQQHMRSPVSPGGAFSVNGDEADVAELKSQIVALKAQLSQSLKNHPKRQASINAYRTLSPQRGGARGMSPDNYNRGRSPSADPRGLSPSRLGNNMRRSSIGERRTDAPSKVVYAEPEQMVPKQIGQRGSLDAEKIGNPEDAINALLQDSELLEEELIEGLIHTLKIVPPEMQKIPAREEVVFPVHIISKCVTQMWRLGYLVESERLLFRAMDTIQKDCLVSTKKSVLCEIVI